MAYQIKAEDVTKKLADQLIDGIILYGANKTIDYARLQFYDVIEKNFKGYSKGAVKVLLSIADLFVPQIRNIPYVGDALGLLGRVGFSEIVETFVDKPPYCVAEDVNTIKCFNFYSTNVKVSIDGTELTAETDYTVSGTPDEITISLSTPMSSGEHEVRVTDEKKAWFGKVRV